MERLLGCKMIKSKLDEKILILSVSRVFITSFIALLISVGEFFFFLVNLNNMNYFLLACVFGSLAILISSSGNYLKKIYFNKITEKFEFINEDSQTVRDSLSYLIHKKDKSHGVGRPC